MKTDLLQVNEKKLGGVSNSNYLNFFNIKYDDKATNKIFLYYV
jgi:hypothetical protein